MAADILNHPAKPENLRRQADDLSLRMYHLTTIAKLAAFSCEARRVLEAAWDVTEYRPEMRKVLTEGIGNSGSWPEMEDVSGDVLAQLARDLEALNTEWTNAMYAAAQSSPEHPQQNAVAAHG